MYLSCPYDWAGGILVPLPASEEAMHLDAAVLVRELRASHERLRGIVQRLTHDDLTGPSYCRDWTVAQVLSHLGSGAELAERNLEAALGGRPPLDPQKDYPPVRQRWESLPPGEQARRSLEANESCLRRLEGLEEGALRALQMPFFSMTLDAAGFVGLRLSEHAVHTWDVEVAAADPKARLAPTAVPLLIDLVLERFGRVFGIMASKKDVAAALAGKLPEGRFVVRTTDPERLAAVAPSAGGAPISLAGGEDGPVVRMPAEAFLRLIYGRLDPERTPEGVTAAPPLTLDELRALFPGF